MIIHGYGPDLVMIVRRWVVCWLPAASRSWRRRATTLGVVLNSSARLEDTSRSPPVPPSSVVCVRYDWPGVVSLSFLLVGGMIYQ